MPVVLEEEMLLPPSLRKRYYRDESIRTTEIIPGSSHRYPADDVASVASASTIEIARPDLDMAPRDAGRPVIIHEDHYVPVSVADPLEPRYINPAGGRDIRYHRGARGGREFEMEYTSRGGRHFNMEYEKGSPRMARRRRARSVDYGRYTDGGYCSSCDEEAVFIDDERRSAYGGRRSRRGSQILPAIGNAIGLTGRQRPVEVVDRMGRRVPPPEEHHHRGRKIAAGAALAATAAGIGLHQLREHRRASRSRSLSSERSGRSRSSHYHPLRRAADIATVGMAAKRLYDRSRSRGPREGSPTGSVYSRRSGRSRSSHRLRHTAELAAAGLAAKRLYDRSRSRGREVSPTGSTYSRRSGRSRSSHRLRHAAELGAAGLAAKKLYNHRSRSRRRASSVSSVSSSDDGGHHRLRNAAGLAGAGIALKKLHDRHEAHKAEEYERGRSRSVSRARSRRYSSSSSSRSPSNVRRHLAAAALGATAAGVAAHEYQKHHPRPVSVTEYYSDDDEPRNHHRMRNAGLAAAGLTAAGLAAAHHRRSRSRRRSASRSSYSSSDDEGGHHHRGRKVAAAAGLTAAGLAAAHHRRHRSRSSSVSSTTSSSSGGGHHRLRNVAAATTAAAAIHRHRKNRSRSRSRSRSRPHGILRNGHEGGGRIRRTMSGALHPVRPRAHSADSSDFIGRPGHHHRHGRVRQQLPQGRREGLMEGLTRHLSPGQGYVEDGSIAESEGARPAGERAHGGRGLIENVRRGLESETSREMAYKVGEGIADMVRDRRDRR